MGQDNNSHTENVDIMSGTLGQWIAKEKKIHDVVLSIQTHSQDMDQTTTHILRMYII